jgi:hypothetical protein
MKQLQLRLSRVRDPREREKEIQSLIGTRTSSDVAGTYANQGAALQVSFFFSFFPFFPLSPLTYANEGAVLQVSFSFFPFPPP